MLGKGLLTSQAATDCPQGLDWGIPQYIVNWTISEDNQRATLGGCDTSFRSVVSENGLQTDRGGKRYMEFRAYYAYCTSQRRLDIGLSNSNSSVNSKFCMTIGSGGLSARLLDYTSTTPGFHNISTYWYLTGYTGTEAAWVTLGIAFDLDAGKMWFSQDGTWLESGDPVAGINPTVTDLVFPPGEVLYPFALSLRANSVNVWLDHDLTYTPEGYTPVCNY